MGCLQEGDHCENEWHIYARRPRGEGLGFSHGSPGHCESHSGMRDTQETDPDTYQATLKLGVAAVKGTYKGSVQLHDKTPPTHYRMLIDGSGTPGFVKGEATIDLAAQDNQTVLTYDADTQVGGLIANVGQRMIGGVAKMIINQALKKLEEELAQY
jgi:uncharacterized protein